MDRFIDLVLSRRSLREYDTHQISREDLTLCMEAARQAPSACNSQEWKFIAIDAPEIKDQISKNVLSGIHGMNTFAHSAAAFIIIVLEPAKIAPWTGAKIMGTDFRRIDLGIACEHIVLQAQDLGIGSCILGWFNERKLKRILGIPLGRKAELMIALGYPPSNHTFQKKRLKDRTETVSFNKY